MTNDNSKIIKRIIIAAVNALCLIAFFICLGISASIKAPLRSQQAAAAWAGQSGERFSQVSAFFHAPSTFDMDGVMRLRSELEKSIAAASLDVTPDRVLYTDAWSAKTELSVMSQRSNPTAIKAIAVGGDFFLFHPLKLRDGNYLSPNDIMKDRVVIDEELAWRLFGAVKVSGFDIIINNMPFVVAGVVSRETDFASSAAYKKFAGEESYAFGAGLFMSYDALLDMTGSNAKIENYEIVLPDPITGFALNALKDNLKSPEALIIENTGRFSFGNITRLIGSYGERSQRNETLIFPYWENAARYAEDWLALLLIFSFIFIAFPIVCSVIYFIILIRFTVKLIKIAIKNFIKKKDKKDYEKYILEHGEDGESYTLNSIIREVNDEIY